MSNKFNIPKVSNEEAIAGGFPSSNNKEPYYVMWEWLWQTYGPERLINEPMNKLTLQWALIER